MSVLLIECTITMFLKEIAHTFDFFKWILFEHVYWLSLLLRWMPMAVCITPKLAYRTRTDCFFWAWVIDISLAFSPNTWYIKYLTCGKVFTTNLCQIYSRGKLPTINQSINHWLGNRARIGIRYSLMSFIGKVRTCSFGRNCRCEALWRTLWPIGCV